MNEENNQKPKYSFEELSKKYLEKTPDEEKSKQNFKTVASDYQMITSFLITIVILIFLGVFLGYQLDLKLKTKPLFILIFTFLGIAASFRNLIKDVNKKK